MHIKGRLSLLVVQTITELSNKLHLFLFLLRVIIFVMSNGDTITNSLPSIESKKYTSDQSRRGSEVSSGVKGLNVKL